MSTNPDGSMEPRDDQQARLVESLRAAGGAPVDFDELRAKGIEHPAVLGYELEVAGVPIVQTRESNRRALALDSPPQERQRDEAPERGGQAASSAASRVIGTASRAVLSRGRWLSKARAAQEPLDRAARAGLQGLERRLRGALGRLDGSVRLPVNRRPARGAMVTAALALTVALAAAMVTALSPHGHGAGASLRPERLHAQARGGPRPPATRAPQRSSTAAAPSRSHLAPVPGGIGAGGAPAEVSPAAAAALEGEGHQLLSDGRYTAAVGRLLGAIRATGQSLAACTEPASESCLTFAYALYDLGRALRLEGKPSAAVPVLAARLRIDNQRTVVEHELELARAGTA
jgi:hypothetical protein